MEYSTLTKKDIDRRKNWITKITQISRNKDDYPDFKVKSEKVQEELVKEYENEGISALLSHLRLCGAIPENYKYNGTEEKLYSKYTDVVIHTAYTSIGLQSSVLTERGDAADVECSCQSCNYDFVADAKAFRLSRTAKNQKDFKVQAINNWKGQKKYAMLICPVYQLPVKESQIYEQAMQSSVCIFTYTHLATLVRYGVDRAREVDPEVRLHDVFKKVEEMKKNPSQKADDYWGVLNKAFFGINDTCMNNIWEQEKTACSESIKYGKEEASELLKSAKETIKQMIKQDENRIDKRIEKVNGVGNKRLLFSIKLNT